MKKFIEKLFIIIIVYLATWACIEPYELPNVSKDFVSSLVIEGNMNNDDTIQTIIVTRTREINGENKSTEAVSACSIEVIDKDGNSFIFDESEKAGTYNSIIPIQYFYPGNTFQLKLISPSGELYESIPEELLEVPEVDSIYFSPIQSGGDETAVQFLVDINGNESQCRNYKWELEETYEYRSKYFAQKKYPASPDATNTGVAFIQYDYYYIDDYGDTIYEHIEKELVIERITPSDSLYYCYKSNPINQILIASTDDLTENQFKGMTLNKVSLSSGKLEHKYSLLVKQFSLTNDAARFLSQMKSNQQDDGMFDGQPITVQGNISNVNNIDERVIGYFGASMVSKKRIFARRYSYNYDPGCTTIELGDRGLDEYAEGASFYNPIYFSSYFNPPYSWLLYPSHCVDCRLKGGQLKKPPYWDDESIIMLE